MRDGGATTDGGGVGSGVADPRHAAIRLGAVTGIVGISFSAIFVRLASVSPETAAFFRALYALPVLVLARAVLAGSDPRSRWERTTAFVAGLLLAVDLSFWHRAIADIGAGLATVLGNTQVVFVGAAGWLLYRERPTATALGVLPAVLGGVVLISGLGRGGTYGADPVAGVLFGLLTGLAYAAFLLLFRSSNRKLAPPAAPLLDATLGTAVGALAVGLLAGDLDLVPSWPSHGWLAALAVVSQAAGWLLITYALPRLAALETSVLLLLQPTATVFWGLLIFDEKLSRLQALGVALVLGGVGLLSVRGSVRRAR